MYDWCSLHFDYGNKLFLTQTTWSWDLFGGAHLVRPGKIFVWRGSRVVFGDRPGQQKLWETHVFSGRAPAPHRVGETLHEVLLAVLPGWHSENDANASFIESMTEEPVR